MRSVQEVCCCCHIIPQNTCHKEKNGFKPLSHTIYSLNWVFHESESIAGTVVDNVQHLDSRPLHICSSTICETIV